MKNRWFMLVDSHAHIYKEYYDDISIIVKRAKKNNVLQVLIILMK